MTGFSDEYLDVLTSLSRGEKSGFDMRITTKVKCLKCVEEIPSCPDLAVGDLLWKFTHEIWPGGYEYVVAHRREDGMVLKFREEYLEDHFEVAEVEGEVWV